MEQTFSARLEGFEGPLDLMIHLIHIHKLDLFELDLFALATQYCNYIQSISDLNIASEYMVEFARLLEYKSKKLLPSEKEEQEEIVEEYRHRLLDYQAYKDKAQSLREMHEHRALLLERAVDEKVGEWKKILRQSLAPGSIEDLLKSYERVLARASADPVLVVESREMDLSQVTERIKTFFKTRRKANLEELLDQFSYRLEKIMAFLYVLEAVHTRELILEQGVLYEG